MTADYLISALLLLVGLVHLYPALGMRSAEQLRSLYGVEVGEPNLLILMRHRAVLFGILGVLLIISAFLRSLQGVAILAGLVSTLSFVVLAASVGEPNARLRKVVVADVAAAAALVVAGALELFTGG